LFAETFADQDLLVLDSFRGIRVLTPPAFWKWGIPARPRHVGGASFRVSGAIFSRR
jgi:hypothetical protein